MVQSIIAPACRSPQAPDTIGGSCPAEICGRSLGGRSTVGHGALDAVIGVRIPASQPDFARPSGELRLGRPLRGRRTRSERSVRRSLSRRSGVAAKADLHRASGAGRTTKRDTITRRLSRRSRTAVSACSTSFKLRSKCAGHIPVGACSPKIGRFCWRAKCHGLVHGRHRSALRLHPQE